MLMAQLTLQLLVCNTLGLSSHFVSRERQKKQRQVETSSAAKSVNCYLYLNWIKGHSVRPMLAGCRNERDVTCWLGRYLSYIDVTQQCPDAGNRGSDRHADRQMLGRHCRGYLVSAVALLLPLIYRIELHTACTLSWPYSSRCCSVFIFSHIKVAAGCRKPRGDGCA